MRVLFMTALLVAGAASAQTFPGGGGGDGASPASVTAALVGQNVNANSYTATTATGPGFSVDAVLACSFDLGPGGRNCLGTNGSGDILLGPNDGGAGTEVRISGTVSALNLNLTNGSLNLVNNASISNPQPGKPVYVTEEEGLTINNTTPLKGRVALAVTFDSASINNGTCLTQSVTVAGALTGDFVRVNADFALPDTVAIGNARVTASNTVALRLCNIDLALPADPASGPYNFVLER